MRPSAVALCTAVAPSMRSASTRMCSTRLRASSSLRSAAAAESPGENAGGAAARAAAAA
eukprot:CAMPEP_0197612488 /NCGR_PEP_ID=MMETSP1326-20131121/57398_1 /TAXON_ID=1155430 /ORGANISM="Genus nov. species nov., Strain RCC2288" /LENGTH=58 /DNA_ID=CAMNT_0043181253 /DNA_START=1 /DNA_END=174 /DNA_ORIENTATION=-